MKHKKLKMSVFFLLSGLSGLMAQENIVATGGDASGGGGSVSYSVGQVFYQTQNGTNGSLSEGVQQPYEISVVTGLEKFKGINLMVTAYPNPATDYLMVKTESEVWEDLSYKLIDMNGKLLQIKSLTGTETRVDMSRYVPATYFIKIIRDNQVLKTYRILKAR